MFFYSTDNEFFKSTIQDILEKLNAFMALVAAKDAQLRHLIPDYIDTLALFISNINEKQIAQVVINQFKAFINMIGR